MLATLIIVLSVAAGFLTEPVIGLSRDGMSLGSIRLFEHAEFVGFRFEMPIYKAATCYNLDCYDNRANSAIWDLPGDGEHGGDAYIYLFEDSDCVGAAQWFNIHLVDRVVDLGQPLANKLSSILVVRASKEAVSDSVVNCTGAALLSSRDSPSQ